MAESKIALNPSISINPLFEALEAVLRMANLVPSERDLGSLPPGILTYFLISGTDSMSGTNAKVLGSVSLTLKAGEAPLGWIGL